MRTLDGIYPPLAEVQPKILAIMAAAGHPMILVSTIRTDEEQAALYAQGRTTPGRIVTNADGVFRRSNHQVHPDGYGHALDHAFLIGGQPSWDLALPWDLYGVVAEQFGCVWGGRWSGFSDRPHIEMV